MQKRDIILISSVLLLSLILFGVFSFLKKDGAYAVVRVNGEEIERYSLKDSGEYSLNGGTNILRIEDGKAFLTSADCPDHLCVKQGKINKTNETITCLPNKLTVTVYGAEESVDFIS